MRFVTGALAAGLMLLATLASGFAEEADRAARLDALFAELKAAPDVAASAPIERKILDIWHSSGATEVDQLMRLTLMAMQRGDYREALDYCDRMIELAPEFAEGWNKRATIYFYIDDFAASMADIERTLVLEPRHFGALAGIGMIMTRLGRKDRAIDAYRKVLEINPNNENMKAAVKQLEDESSTDL